VEAAATAVSPWGVAAGVADLGVAADFAGVLTLAGVFGLGVAALGVAESFTGVAFAVTGVLGLAFGLSVFGVTAFKAGLGLALGL